MEFLEIFDKAEEALNYKDVFSGSSIIDFKIAEEQRRIELTIGLLKIVPKSVIMAVAKNIREVYGLNAIKIFTRYDSSLFSAEYYSEILTYITLKIRGTALFLEGSEAKYEDGVFTVFLAKKGRDMLISNDVDGEIKKLANDEFGLDIEVVINDGEEDDTFGNIDDYNTYRDEMIKETIETEMKETLAAMEEKKNNPVIMGNPISGTSVKMSELNSDSGRVIVEGEIFHIEEKETRTGAVILMIYVSTLLPL